MDTLEWCGSLGSSGPYGLDVGDLYSGASGGAGADGMMVDEDYMELMSDTFFTTISANQPIYFPDTREIGQQSITSSSPSTDNSRFSLTFLFA